jgi:hypothetical protein
MLDESQLSNDRLGTTPSDRRPVRHGCKQDRHDAKRVVAYRKQARYDAMQVLN